MTSIVRILKSQSMLGSKDYTKLDSQFNSMYLFSKNKDVSPNSIVECSCNVSDGDLGYAYGTSKNPHDPIHMGFAVTQTSSASMNPMMIAEQIHLAYNGSTDITSIFKDIFPNISGEVSLHEDLDGIKTNICNKQHYLFGPVEKEFQETIKREYSQIMGQDLLPF